MQIAWQVADDTNRVTVHGSVDVHSPGVGQAPGRPVAIAVSQVSPGWTMPSPQVGEQ